MSNVSYNEPQLVASRLCAKCGGVVVPGVSGPALVDEEGTWHRRCAVVPVPSYVYSAIQAILKQAEHTKWVTASMEARYAVVFGMHEVARMVRLDPWDWDRVQAWLQASPHINSAPHHIPGLPRPAEWVQEHWSAYLRGLCAGFEERTHTGEEVKL